MTKHMEPAALALAAAVLICVLSGCQKAEGPAEHAGKAIDKAMDNAGRQVEDAGEALRDASKGSGK